MKKNSTWYQLLPEPYHMQAIHNAEKEDMLGREAPSLSAALCAFSWKTAPEGHDYWQAVYQQALEGGFDEK